jgi:alpha-galactosidase
MSFPRFFASFFAALALLCTAGRAAADTKVLDGTWCMTQTKGSGVTLKTFITLHQTGNTLSGSVLANSSADLPIRDAHWEGSDAVFRVDWGWSFRVTPEDDDLHVVISFEGGGKEESVATRASASDMTPPSVLPLPGIIDLGSNGLALTPPMGWNSWNHFAEGVDDKVVRETADALVSSGMAAAGYVYINIDDTWEGGRDAVGAIVPNKKFPNMGALADYVHSKGLKLGIYSSPGPVTCGGYPGSYGHEEQDAKVFAGWGIDYLKYDWCSASRLYGDNQLRASYQKMGAALLKCGRPIVYSLCEYGSNDVWTWGPNVAGNLWRTTGDIQDNWRSMTHIGFNQGKLAPYAGPGHWNDPDMLEVGNGGMTATEYRTHFSLWCLLAAPLIAGNDLRSMSAQTREILTNREVIAIDQDPLGTEATRIQEADGLEIWSRPLQGGALAVGIFNRNEAERPTEFAWSVLGLASKPAGLRDLWVHQDLAVSESFSGTVPAHGVLVLHIQP